MIPTLVVVPPISNTTASSTPLKNAAPLILLAGPDNIVSTGNSLAVVSLEQNIKLKKISLNTNDIKVNIIFIW